MGEEIEFQQKWGVEKIEFGRKIYTPAEILLHRNSVTKICFANYFGGVFTIWLEIRIHTTTLFHFCLKFIIMQCFSVLSLMCGLIFLSLFMNMGTGALKWDDPNFRLTTMTRHSNDHQPTNLPEIYFSLTPRLEDLIFSPFGTVTLIFCISSSKVP